MTTRNTTKIADTSSKRISGLTKHVSAKTGISINQESMKLSDVVAVYQATIDARTALQSQRDAAKIALQNWEEANASQSSIDKGLKSWVDVTYGLDSQEARDMGFAPRKIGTKTVATKQAAVDQAEATRAARHTMGKRQKADIKGVVVSPSAP